MKTFAAAALLSSTLLVRADIPAGCGTPAPLPAPLVSIAPDALGIDESDKRALTRELAGELRRLASGVIFQTAEEVELAFAWIGVSQALDENPDLDVAGSLDTITSFEFSMVATYSLFADRHFVRAVILSSHNGAIVTSAAAQGEGKKLEDIAATVDQLAQQRWRAARQGTWRPEGWSWRRSPWWTPTGRPMPARPSS